MVGPTKPADTAARPYPEITGAASSGLDSITKQQEGKFGRFAAAVIRFARCVSSNRG
jgi:hypothetical protein